MDNLYKNIEDYLKGNMSDPDKKVFEEAMQNDKELQEKVQIQAGTNRFLDRHHSGFDALNAQLSDEFFPKQSSKSKWYLQIGIIAVIIIAIVYLYAQNREVIHSKLFNQSNLPEDQVPNINNTNQSDTISLPPETTTPKDIPPVLEEEIDEVNQPIADASDAKFFKENQQLEMLIRENIRSNSSSFTIIEPIKTNITSSKTSNFTVFELTGRFDQDFNYTIEFYDNAPNAYAEDKPVLVRSLTTNNKKIQQRINLKLSKGLYYYIINVEDTNMPLLVDKFLIGR